MSIGVSDMPSSVSWQKSQQRKVVWFHKCSEGPVPAVHGFNTDKKMAPSGKKNPKCVAVEVGCPEEPKMAMPGKVRGRP